MTDLGPKKNTQKTFGPKKCPQKNMDSDDNFCAQDPHKNLWFQCQTLIQKLSTEKHCFQLRLSQNFFNTL